MNQSPARHHRPHPQPGGFLPLLLVLLIWCGAVGASFFRYQPVPVRAADASPHLFSAGRAEVFFERLYKEATPHPAGRNADFREQVVAAFEQLGYQVEQHRTSSSPRNRRTTDEQVPLVNLLARLPGKSDQPPVMLAAHYDSHPDGPGAADDGVGVCVMLEIARMLRHEPPPERPILFFLSDGEEFGLLGARRFVEENDVAERIAAVINLEARGTCGPSLMFETSSHSWWLVNLFANTARRPLTSSLFYEIYRFLPNDTDFSVFRQHGMQGFNFAFIGDVKNYHNSQDNFENVDRRSLQHQGENALPLLRELANTDVESQPAGQAVYFDFYGLLVVRWPVEFSPGLVAIGVLLSGWFWFRYSGEAAVSRRSFRAGLISVVAGPIAILAVALFGKLLDLGYTLDAALENPFPARPFPIQASYWTWGLAVLLALGWLIRDHVTWRVVWFAVWMLWAALAAATAVTVAGASFLFIVPLLVTGIAVVPTLLTGDPARQAVRLSCVGAIAAAVIWLPLERLFYDAVGFSLNAALIARVALVLPTLLPLLVVTQRRALGRLAVVALSISVGLTLWAVAGN